MLSAFDHEIKHGLAVLKDGGVALLPTDTIWGLHCDPFNEEAIHRVAEIKKRTKLKKFILVVANKAALNHYVQLHDVTSRFLDTTREPTTLIFPEAKNLPKYLLHTDGSIAIRIISISPTAAFLDAFQKPLVSTSANISEHNSPSTFSEISPEILKSVDYIFPSILYDTRVSSPSKLVKLSKVGKIIEMVR